MDLGWFWMDFGWILPPKIEKVMVLGAQTELDGPLQHNTARESLLGTIEVEITTQKSSLGALSQINLFISTILTSV